MALLTVVVPTFRRPELLRRAVDSVLTQDFKDLVVLVCDNASGDDTADVVAGIARADPRVRYHANADNVGFERNFEVGLSLVDTPYFAFLSDDDLALPHCYSALMKGFESHPDVMISCGEALHVIAPNHLYNLFLRNWSPGVYQPPDGAYAILKNGLPFWSSMVFRRELLDMVGGIDPATGPLIDLDFTLRCTLKGQMLVTRTPCTIFFSHEDAISRVKHLTFVWPGWLKLTANAIASARLSEPELTQLRELLLATFVSVVSFTSLGCIRKRRFDEGIEGGRLLSTYGQNTLRGAAITSLARAAKVLPFMTALMTLGNQIRRWRSSRLVSERESYAPYLAHLSDRNAAPSSTER